MRQVGALVLALAAALTLAGCSDGSSSSRTSQGPGPTVTPTSSAETTGSADSTDLITDVDLGGRRMHVTCFGPVDETQPTLLFEAGGDSPSDVWDPVMDVVTATHRACSYDRAGLGASGPAPEPVRTNKDLVADLEAMLDLAGITGPFVLVGHSLADMPLTVFTAAHREDVLGVVLVEPRAPGVSARFLAALPLPRTGEPEAVRAWREDELGAFEHDPSLNREHLLLARMNQEANALLDPPGPFFGDVPLVVLGASERDIPFQDLPPRIVRKFDRIWLEEQQRLAEESDHGSFEIVPNSRHNIELEQPRAVIDAIESVLAAVSG
jgi:pimeloyl-ACP methyl ester carboxylesterase